MAPSPIASEALHLMNRLKKKRQGWACHTIHGQVDSRKGSFLSNYHVWLCVCAEAPSVAASPFASQAMGSMADLPSTSRAAAEASSSALPKGYSNNDLGQDINLWYQPSSDAVTRAGDVLGMPHLDGYTAKVRLGHLITFYLLALA